MDNIVEAEDKIWILGMIIIMLAILMVGITLGALLVNPYRSGQIDAINGKIYYELREMDNGEMKWRRIEEVAP